MRRIGAALSLVNLIAVVAAAQSNTPPSTATAPVGNRAPYLQRGDEVERRYGVHREQLERFFKALDQRFEKEVPELRSKLAPPTPVAFGYQILPVLLPTPAWPPRPSRVILSPYSWSRTDSMIDRGRADLALLETRFQSAGLVNNVDRRREYGMIADEYRKLVASQKLIASTIAYNRLWQGEIARQPQFYMNARTLQDAALTRQLILDSLSTSDARLRPDLARRADSLSKRIEEAIRKLPTPDFVRVERPTPHKWVVSVPVFTDIADSAFVGRVRSGVQNAWHVRDGDDEFSLLLEIHQIPHTQIYPKGDAPAAGAHVDIAKHVTLFPVGGVVLTTGGNSIYATGRSIIVGPHAIPMSAVAHEFGHMLGFKDGYFRSYKDRGADGYEVLEVILDPENVVAAPENGRVRREHFEQVLRGKQQ